MSSTYFSGSAGLARVLPFPAQIASRDSFPTDSLRHFELAAGALERAMDFGALLVTVRLAYKVAVWRNAAAGAIVTGHAATVAAIAFGMLAVLLLERSGEYRPCLSLLACGRPSDYCE